MELIKKLAQLLGLGEDATEEQVEEALEACVAENKSLKEQPGGDGKQPPQQPENVVANKAVCELLGLKAGAATEDVTAAIMELKGGKITPAQKDWAREYALTAPKGFAAFVEKAPQVVPLDEIAGGSALALKSDKPDEATTLACKLLGVSDEDRKKYGMKKED